MKNTLVTFLSSALLFPVVLWAKIEKADSWKDMDRYWEQMDETTLAIFDPADTRKPRSLGRG
jgi:hypothetical protein